MTGARGVPVILLLLGFGFSVGAQCIRLGLSHECVELAEYADVTVSLDNECRWEISS